MASTGMLSVRTEFASALNQICAERGITPESVLDTIKAAILAAYRKDFGIDDELEYEVELDAQTGAAKVIRSKEGKEKKDVTPPGFGRIAAQTAKQVILQKIREAEKSAILDEYKDRVGQLVNGMVLRFDGKDIICDIGRGQGRMLVSEQVPSEKYRLNQRLTLYIKEIKDTSKGRQIIVSRAADKMVSLLFKREVPEVASGSVEIKAIAREPGNRTKIAVASTQPGVDPVGSCVGQKGVRVQAVIDELNGEKIDVIPYNNDLEKFIKASLSPAEKITLTLDEKNKKALVEVPEDQLSLTIGRDGQNVRLAAKLTGYKIDIKEFVQEDQKQKKVKTEAKTKRKTASSKKETKSKAKKEKKKTKKTELKTKKTRKGKTDKK